MRRFDRLLAAALVVLAASMPACDEESEEADPPAEKRPAEARSDEPSPGGAAKPHDEKSRVAWTWSASSMNVAAPSHAGGRVFTADTNRFVALDLESGRRLWQYTPPTGKMFAIQATSPPVATDEIALLVIGEQSPGTGPDDQLGLIALDAESGGVEWRFETPGGIYPNIQLHDGLVWFLADRHDTPPEKARREGSWPVDLYALDPADGEIVGDHPTGLTSPPSYGDSPYQRLALAGETVVFARVTDAKRYELVAMHAESGEERWTAKLPVGTVPTTPLADGENLYVALDDRGFPDADPDGFGIVAFGLESGDERWRAGTDRPVTGLELSGGTLVGATVEAGRQTPFVEPVEILGVEPESGKVAWRYVGPEEADIERPLVAGDHLAIHATLDDSGEINLLDPADGSVVETIRAPRYSSRSIHVDGRLVFRTTSGLTALNWPR